MEEILQHRECRKPRKHWGKLPNSTGERRNSEPSTKISSEQLWLEDYFPLKMFPFQGTCHFSGGIPTLIHQFPLVGRRCECHRPLDLGDAKAARTMWPKCHVFKKKTARWWRWRTTMTTTTTTTTTTNIEIGFLCIMLSFCSDVGGIMKDFDPLIWMSYFYQAGRSCLAQQQCIERHSCEKKHVFYWVGWDGKCSLGKAIHPEKMIFLFNNSPYKS